MAGKKKEGIGALKEISGGKKREDRNASGKTYFDPISIDAKNALTVIYLLKSPEDDIMLRAVASLEGFGRKDLENLKCLCSLGICQYLYPLIRNTDFIVRRFTLKLIGMLSKLEEFREQLLQKENILETFALILKTDADVLLQEFSSLTLANLSGNYVVASDLLQVVDIIETLFNRVKSLDPDVEKNCLEIMNHLLNDINGIEAFIESSGFDIQPILELISSSYPVIQALALNVLTQLSSWCRDNRVLIAIRNAAGIEQIITVLEKEEWSDLHLSAADLLLNITDDPEMCDYIYRSGCLHRFVKLVDTMTKMPLLERMLGVLARMSQSTKARPALHSVEAEKRFITYLEESSDCIQQASCLGLANQSQYYPSLENILEENPIPGLMGIIVNSQKSQNLRNVAAYTLNVLSNTDERVPEILLLGDDFDQLLSILMNNAHLPAELCQNVIQVLIGISSSERFRPMAISEKLFEALASCFPESNNDFRKDVSLQVDALECTSEFLVESQARAIFIDLNGVDLTLNCLRSKFASVREWAGHLVVIASQSQDFVKAFVRKNGLQWMLKEKNTMYSMPSWQSAIESIFSNFLPAKFAFTGRLDFQDITKDGFYILTQPNAKFVELQYFFEEKISPIIPIYVASFSTPLEFPEVSPAKSTSSPISVPQAGEPQNLDKYMKGADRNSQQEYVWQGSLNTYPSVDYEAPKVENEYSDPLEQFFPDSFLNEHLENLKNKIAKEESCIGDSSWLSLYRKVICERAKIIAEFVADEMSGPDPDPVCSAQYKIMQINEIKHFLGSNIIPLGLIRMGDYLERAMLFKVLADRIGFTCALVRGCYGRAWIEIAVPIINIDEQEEEAEKINCSSEDSEVKLSCQATAGDSSNKSVSQCSNESSNKSAEEVNENEFWFSNLDIKNFKGFPNHYLKPNAIVDLVTDPGRILNINSYEAKEYCGGFIFNKISENKPVCYE